VTAIVAAPGFAESDVLAFAASVERGSEHPLATAIVRAATERNLPLSKVRGFDSPPGKGAIGLVDGKRVVLGNERFLAELSIATAPLAAEAERLRADGATVIFVSLNGQPAALIAVADPVKTHARDTLGELRAAGIGVIMLTGDNPVTAAAVARTLGIADVRANVLPEQKSNIVTALRDAGRVVAMAGDGINDAPALAAADVGIAMGTGTDIAMESAGITLLRGDLRGIVRARLLSAAAMRNIRQNLLFAFLYNAAGVPIAAGLLYPAFGILLSPMIAAAAMALSSVSVIGNALRLRGVRL
ncbi:MAG: HAD-IC family P-type ATPase, partial [Pseudorhodoplanes sp.]